jgi:hypothetical protein
MAGTIVASTLSDGTNSTSTTNCIIGSAKAWVNFYGLSASTINNSFNVSSVTRNSTGNYTINFTTAMPNANYILAGGVQTNTTSADLVYGLGVNNTSTAMQTTSVNVVCGYYNNATLSDVYSAQVVIFGS